MLKYLKERDEIKNNFETSPNKALEKILQKNGEILIITRKSAYQQNGTHRFLYEGHFEGYTRTILFKMDVARNGKVRNPDQKDRYGFYIGKYMVDKRIYLIWKNMERRCYDPNSQSYSNYGAKGITVSDSFKCYEYFEKWYKAHDNGLSTFEIDKDVKTINKSKIYSPETCILIPPAINTFISTLGERKGIEEVHNSINTTYCVHYRRKYKSVNKNFKTLEEAKIFKRKLDIDYLEILLAKYNLSDDIKQLLRNYVKVCRI